MEQVDSPRFSLRSRVVKKVAVLPKAKIAKTSKSVSTADLPSISVNVSSSTRIGEEQNLNERQLEQEPSQSALDAIDLEQSDEALDQFAQLAIDDEDENGASDDDEVINTRKRVDRASQSLNETNTVDDQKWKRRI